MNQEKNKYLERLDIYYADKEILSKEEVAKYLGVSKSCINGMMEAKTNPLKKLKFGVDRRSTIKISKIALSNFLQNVEDGSSNVTTHA
jgi:predicted DNA-binding transcriptional regulator AlpA